MHALRVEPHGRGSQSGAFALRRKPPQTDPLAQYFSSGTSFYEHAPGAYRMVKADKREKIVVVASEPYDDDPRWVDVPDRHLVSVTPDGVSLEDLQ